MVGFHRDDEGDWVAHLSCGHTQHVRHRPPFQDRAWVLDDAGRSGRLGAPLECPLCDRGEMPDGLRAVRTTPSWDAASLPAGLRGQHHLASGVWARLVVEDGELTVRFAGPPPVEATLSAGAARAIPPEALHRVELAPGARFHLEISRLAAPDAAVPPPAGAEDCGGEGPCLAHLVCPDCGRVVGDGGGHAPDCPSG